MRRSRNGEKQAKDRYFSCYFLLTAGPLVPFSERIDSTLLKSPNREISKVNMVSIEC